MSAGEFEDREETTTPDFCGPPGFESKNQYPGVDYELEEVRRTCTNLIPQSTLVTCVPAQIRLQIRRTEHKQLTAVLQLPPEYPHVPAILELKSKTLSEKLLDGLVGVADAHLKTILNKPQVISVLQLISKFIDDNPLCVCSEELARIKRLLLTEQDVLKLKQKTSEVVLKIQDGRYFIKFRIAVPHEYPLTQISVDLQETTYPESLTRFTSAQAVEIARQCVQPPLKKNPKSPAFVPKPSLFPVADFLARERYATKCCPICSELCLPSDPKDIIADEAGDKFVERMYCTHLYHHGCLDVYMKTPPFAGGKKCPASGCGKRLYHEKWKATPELAEARWAHKQARERELGEVVEFMQD